MKRIIVMVAGLAAVATGVVGCLSAQLRSEDQQTRLAAVGEVKEQAVLQEIAEIGCVLSEIMEKLKGSESRKNAG